VFNRIELGGAVKSSGLSRETFSLVIACLVQTCQPDYDRQDELCTCQPAAYAARPRRQDGAGPPEVGRDRVQGKIGGEFRWDGPCLG
jgi:hypothetical protein